MGWSDEYIMITVSMRALIRRLRLVERGDYSYPRDLRSIGRTQELQSELLAAGIPL
jgi:hypothetical protein